MDAINKENYKYCIKIYKKILAGQIKDRPRVSVTCARNGEGRYFSAFSRSPQNKYFYPLLHAKIQKLGGVGSMGLSNNKLGACAEQHAANAVLRSRNCLIKDILFSKALIIRTKKRIKYCDNCKALFNI